MKQKQWYAKEGSGGQGTIADEETGRTVATAYDAEDMYLLAAAPKLLRACSLLLSVMEAEPEACGFYKAHKQLAEEAIKVANGG